MVPLVRDCVQLASVKPGAALGEGKTPVASPGLKNPKMSKPTSGTYGLDLFVFGNNHEPTHPMEGDPKTVMHIEATSISVCPSSMQPSHADPAGASPLVCSPLVLNVGGQAATNESPHDCIHFADNAKAVTGNVFEPSGSSTSTHANLDSPPPCDSSTCSPVGGLAAACTSPLALSPLACYPAPLLGSSPLPSSPRPPSTGDCFVEFGPSDQRVGGLAAAIDNPHLHCATNLTTEANDGKLLDAHDRSTSAKTFQSDLKQDVCCTSAQRHRSRSPLPARQDSSP